MEEVKEDNKTSMNTEASTALDTMEVFNRLFKFQVGQQLRHKGDTKDYSADMGLLVTARVLVEQKDDDNSVTFRREYHCRMIRFSGSGEIAAFREHELMTVEEYTQQKVQDEAERNRMRNEVKQTEKEIHEAFGVDFSTRVYLKDANGNVDKSSVFRYSGFSFTNGKPEMTLTEVIASLDKPVDRNKVNVTSKDQFEIVQ
jgi:hypothetical protein